MESLLYNTVVFLLASLPVLSIHPSIIPVTPNKQYCQTKRVFLNPSSWSKDFLNKNKEVEVDDKEWERDQTFVQR